MGKRRTHPPADAVFIAEQHAPQFRSGDLVHEKAADAFYAVAKLMCPLLGSGSEDDYVRFSCTHLPCIPEISVFYPRYGAKLHQVSAAQRTALNNLFISVQEAIEAAHRQGLDQGRNLLVGLARGELTADQMQGLKPTDDA